MTILNDIIAHKRLEVAELKKKKSIADFQNQIKTLKRPRSFLQMITAGNGFHFICEAKKASPSKGVIQPDYNPVRQACMYEQNGAAAVSVLTDEKYFMGSLDHLRAIRAGVDLPLLRKDFIIDPIQIYQAREAGADMILLIAQIIDKNRLDEYLHCARELQLETLLELSNIKEIDKLPNDLSSVVIGINNRDLHTFKTDLNTSLQVKKHLPPDVPVISESGIENGGDCRLLFNHGFSGALIGETLMRSANPGKTLKEMKLEVEQG